MPVEPSEKAPRALAVDDNPGVLFLLASILQELAFRVDTASGGLEGLAAAQTVPYDIIVLDVRMPDIDGFSVARALRCGQGPNRNTPILAVSGDWSVHPPSERQASGISGHVTKPFTVRQLGDAIAALLSPAQDGAQALG